jgi:hypothetical protein
MTRPEGAEEQDFAVPNVEPDLKPTFYRPFRAVSWVGFIPGVQTPGLVLLSLRAKSGALEGTVIWPHKTHWLNPSYA